MSNRISVPEMLMTLISGLSLALVARGWTAFTLTLCALAAASWFIPWRQGFSNRNRFLFQALVAAPFLGSAGFVLSQKPHPVELAMRLATLGAVYLFCNAVLEIYRKPETARPSVLHAGTLTLMLVGGIGTENPYYHLCLAIYAGAALLFLRRPNSGLSGEPASPPPRSPRWIVALCFSLALLLAYRLLGSVPHLHQVAMNVQAEVMSGEGEEEDRLFGVGTGLWSVENLDDSREVVARVFGPRARLRGRVGVYYRDGRWFDPNPEFVLSEKITGQGRFQLPGPAPQDESTWLIEPISKIDGPLPAPRGLYCLKAKAETCHLGSFDQIHCELDGGYEVTASSSPGEERSPKRLLPGNWRWQVFLETPMVLEPALEQAAKSLLNENSTPSDMARDLEGRLAGRAAYGNYEWRQRGFPIENFLLKKSKGGSGLHASAMALLLRHRGVPTRYVVGYVVSEKNMWGGYYTVRARDAHAWVEVYLEEQGWVTFDPTPPEALSARYPNGTENWSREAFLDNLRVQGQRLKKWLQARDWGRFLQTGLSILLVIGLTAILRNRRRRTDAKETREQARLGLLFERAVKLLSSLGLERKDSETPLELARRACAFGEMSRWLKNYSELRFGVANENDVKGLEQSLDSVVRSLQK